MPSAQTEPVEPNQRRLTTPSMTVSAGNELALSPSQVRRQLTALWAQAYELTRRFEILRVENARLRETHVELRGSKIAAR